MYLKFWKPVIDFCSAAVLLVLLSPLLIVLILALLLTQGFSIFFIQKRNGRACRRFAVYKFRTLKDSAPGHLSIAGRKYTILGKTFRRLGLDELPQLLNVLKGEMSFVGPRPLPVEYEDRYSEEQLRRFELRPGITGWSQVNGRNKTSWTERFSMDIWYNEHVSFTLDLRILITTAWITLTGLIHLKKDEDVMEMFKGTKPV